MPALRIGVVGASGRMGSETCAAISHDPDLELAVKVTHSDSLDALVEEDAEVAVDFTTPSAVAANVAWCLDRGIHAVVGTTGLSDDDVSELRRKAEASGANAIIAPNFAVGAVLMMRFATEAAPHFDRAEIIERHHENKLDAPSGTAARTAALMSARRPDGWGPTGAEAKSRGEDHRGVRIHSVRVPGSVAHQEVILGARGQTLTIRHDSIDRASFMPGVLLAVKAVAKSPGVTVGLERLLFPGA